MSSLTDKRVHAYRPDLADVALSSEVTAERYVEPKLSQCLNGVLPMFGQPDGSSRLISQIRYGEFVDIFEFRDDGYLWVQNRTDRYVGYLPPGTVLSEKIASFSNRITALRTFIYPEPDIKSPPLDELTLGSYVSLDRHEGNFMALSEGGFVFAKHVKRVEDMNATDYVFTAGRFLDIPYLWGGRTPGGLDCSGLVQLVLDLAGFECPRDSDQQREALGKPLPSHWRDMAWRRGDLVFFPGHVGIMTGADHIIHASAHDMKVVVEPVFDIVMRGNEILSYGNPRQ